MSVRSDPESDTTSLEASYLRTVTIQNRQFQHYALENRIQFVPIDEDEVERLEIQHNVLNRVFDDKLIFPPMRNPKNILDCGYGAANWAVEVAENYPECEVIGVDISPHMKPDETPENLWLQLDDLNQSFTYPRNTFDLVHSRLITGGINKSRWPGYLRDVLKVLKPGGWFQMVELYYNCQSDNGSLTEEHALREWSTKYLSALEEIKDLRAPLRLNTMMANAGFVDMESKMIPLPLCAWSRDPREFEIGNLNRQNVQKLLGNLSLYPFTERLGMALEEMLVLVARARSEADDPSLKAYFPLLASSHTVQLIGLLIAVQVRLYRKEAPTIAHLRGFDTKEDRPFSSKIWYASVAVVIEMLPSRMISDESGCRKKEVKELLFATLGLRSIISS
ncbi:MAG: hypothetical protein M1827_004050 [Pycnora praestabilis]|nr:MAG: hypothetical protein M1827_004050 [Pycnora praestabilis]